MSFFENEYLLENPTVAEAVNNGFFNSGFDHYLQFWQFEQREVAFTGSIGSDFLPESPVGVPGGVVDLLGVSVTLDAQGNRIYETDVAGDGGTGSDTFLGGDVPISLSWAYPVEISMVVLILRILLLSKILILMLTLFSWVKKLATLYSPIALL